MKKDRLVVSRGHFINRLEARLVERSPVDVAVNLQAVGAELLKRSFGFLGGRLWVVHRQGGHVAFEAVRMIGHELGKPLIGEARELYRDRWISHGLERRHPDRKDLGVVLELIHHAEARIEIEDSGDVLHPLADASAGALQRLDFRPKLFGEEVVEGIDVAHERETPFGQLGSGESCSASYRSVFEKPGPVSQLCWT